MADIPSSFVPDPSLDANYHEDEFLRVELHTGLMFARIARQARYQEKRDRNCAQARRAYDALLRFMPKLPNGKFVGSDEMTRGLGQLKSELQQLGEPL